MNSWGSDLLAARCTLAETSARPIVLIDGLWMTPRCWEHWIARYEDRGHRVLAPVYPGLEVDVEALRDNPAPIEALTVPRNVEHLERIVGELAAPPSSWVIRSAEF